MSLIGKRPFLIFSFFYLFFSIFSFQPSDLRQPKTKLIFFSFIYLFFILQNIKKKIHEGEHATWAGNTELISMKYKKETAINHLNYEIV